MTATSSKQTPNPAVTDNESPTPEEIIRFKDQLYIAAGSQRTSTVSEVLKRDDTFAVLDQLGEIGATGVSEHGIYYRGTRHLSRWELFASGTRPMLLNSTMDKANSHLVVQMTTSDVHMGDTFVVPHGTLHLFRTLHIEDGGFYEGLRLTNYTSEELDITLEYRFAADFVDVFEVRGAPRKHRGEMLEPTISDHCVSLRYAGADERQRSTTVAFDGDFDDQTVDGERFLLEVRLPAGASHVLKATLKFENTLAEGGPNVHINDVARATATSSTVSREADWDLEVTTSNEQFNEWLSRSLADLRMLTANTAYGPYPHAGVPWFATPFGRDALITAMQCLWAWPELARGTLDFLAAHQANKVDPDSEAEPGKILHEMRDGEMAAMGEVPFRCYYGTVDATPLFVMLAGAYYRRTGNIRFIKSIWSNIRRAVQWIDEFGDYDNDGFVEYQAHNDRGLIHQCWKDSHDSIFHSDGRDAMGPIAVSEVQGYIYAAKNSAAELADVLGDEQWATQLRTEARELKERFNEHFWSSAIQTYAIALDGENAPCEVRSSNSGHLLYCGIVDDVYATPTARTLTSEASFNGWGIRTISRGEARYNPMSYHNGSIWPHDTAIGGAGLARYGFKDLALQVFNGLYDASLYHPLNRLPELFCGFDRLQGHGPTMWPVACSPQAWAAGASFMMLQALLGLTFNASENQISFEQPVLPSWLQRLRIRNLRVDGGVADIALNRHTRDLGLYVERKEGDVKIVVVN